MKQSENKKRWEVLKINKKFAQSVTAVGLLPCR